MKRFMLIVIAFLLVACAKSTDRCPTCPLLEESGCQEDLVDKCECQECQTCEEQVCQTCEECVQCQECEVYEEVVCEDCEDPNLVDRCQFAEFVYWYIYQEDEQAVLQSVSPDLSLSDYCFASANTLVSKGLMTLFPDGTFRPQEYLTRAEALTIIMETMEIPKYHCPDELSVYADIGFSDDYLNYAEGAAYYGLMCGIDFYPDAEEDRGGCAMATYFFGDKLVDQDWLYRVGKNIKVAKANGFYEHDGICKEYSSM